MASAQELSDFLSSVEQRAFKQAVYAVRDDDAAMDIVQDAMIKLAEKYGDRGPAELPPLFQRILQNATTDHFRRSKVRSLWTTLLSAILPDDEDRSDQDALEILQSAAGMPGHASAADEVERSQIMAAIETEIAKLPPTRPQSEVEAELKEIRRARLHGGRRHRY